MDFFLCVVGMVIFIEGFPYAAFPDTMKSWMQKMLETPASNLRAIGLSMMLTGLCLLYWGKR